MPSMTTGNPSHPTGTLPLDVLVNVTASNE